MVSGQNKSKQAPSNQESLKAVHRTQDPRQHLTQVRGPQGLCVYGVWAVCLCVCMVCELCTTGVARSLGIKVAGWCCCSTPSVNTISLISNLPGCTLRWAVLWDKIFEVNGQRIYFWFPSDAVGAAGLGPDVVHHDRCSSSRTSPVHPRVRPGHPLRPLQVPPALPCRRQQPQRARALKQGVWRCTPKTTACQTQQLLAPDRRVISLRRPKCLTKEILGGNVTLQWMRYLIETHGGRRGKAGQPSHKCVPIDMCHIVS